MTTVDFEKKEPFWRRHLGALIVGGLVVLLLVNVGGQLLEDGDVSGWLADVPEQWAYVLTLLFIWFDAVIPIFPGETTLSAASTIAASGGLDLGMIMLAGAVGAILGDSSLFWIARLSSAKMQPHLDKALENEKVRVAWDGLNRSPGLLIVAGRYVPGMRFVVNASMGLSDIRYPRFLAWSVLSGVLWSVYTCALAYWVATSLSGYPLASLVISSLITSAALAAVYFVSKHKRQKAEGCRVERCERRAGGSLRCCREMTSRDLTAARPSATDASERHIAVAVPVRAVERNKRVAASVLAGGVAYKLFLWLLPFGLIVGGALGLSNADSAEDAAAGGGIPGAISNAIGDAARSADSESWWLFAVGVPLLLWAGFTGAKAVQLVHALVWDEPPPKTRPLLASLAFTGMTCAAIAVVTRHYAAR